MSAASPKRIFAVAILAAVFAAPFAPLAQEPQPPAAAQAQPVTLYVTALDRNGQPIKDLAKEDMRLFEDGKEQKIDSLALVSSTPLFLGLLIDTSGSRIDESPGAEHAAAPQFFTAVLRSGDSAFVMSFDVQSYVLSDLTDKVEQLVSAVQRAGSKPPRGETALYDAIARACKEMLPRSSAPKALVLLTDGGDNHSRTSEREALRIAQATDTAIHVIYLGRIQGHRILLTPEEIGGEAILRDLAQQTGGLVVSVNSKREFGAAFEKMAEVIRGQYALEYHPTNTARDGKFRRLRIKTTRKGVELTTRPGYYAPKD